MRKPHQNAIISGIKWHISWELSKYALGSCGISHVSKVEGWEVYSEIATQGQWGDLMNKARKKCYTTKVIYVREKFCLPTICIQLALTKIAIYFLACAIEFLKLYVSHGTTPMTCPSLMISANMIMTQLASWHHNFSSFSVPIIFSFTLSETCRCSHSLNPVIRCKIFNC